MYTAGATDTLATTGGVAGSNNRRYRLCMYSADTLATTGEAHGVYAFILENSAVANKNK